MRAALHEGEAEEVAPEGLTLEAILAAPGNLAPLLDPDVLSEIGRRAVEEYMLDCRANSDWRDQAQRALKRVGMGKRDAKNTPFESASNVKYPVLSTAALQFHARAYPAILRKEGPIEFRTYGYDEDGSKAARAQRLRMFAAFELTERMPEWVRDTDTLLLHLPTVGQAWRKAYWNPSRGVVETGFRGGLDVICPPDAPSFQRVPRMSELVKLYPYEIRRLERSGEWLETDWHAEAGGDTQALVSFVEQFRYEDLDGDGLEEPYIVTVCELTRKVARLEPAFDIDDVRLVDGRAVGFDASPPWIPYGFIPDPEGRLYSVGFGHLLHELQEVLDTAINQMMDAGTWANTWTGFIQGGDLRGGEVSLAPGKFLQMPGVSRENIVELRHPGPSPVMFQLIEFLLGAMQDLTATKDVLTGEAPAQQPATATLALIEQGLQMFGAIYQRLYASLAAEFRLMCKLWSRYLDDERYQVFLDQQQAGQVASVREDFNLRDMDVRPSADPSVVTQAQELARAQFLAQTTVGDPAFDQTKVKRRLLEAARITGIEELLNPQAGEAAQALAQTQAQEQEAKTAKTAAEAALKDAQAKEVMFGIGNQLGSLGGVAESPGNPASDAAAATAGQAD